MRARVDPPESIAGASPSDVAEILRLLRQMAEDIHRLATRAPRVLHPIAAYGTDYGELLRAIAVSSKGQKFTVSELLETISDRAEDRRLRDAIVDALGGVNGRSLGKLLRRVEGADIDGLRVARVGSGRDGIDWRVATFAGLKPAVTVAPPASK